MLDLSRGIPNKQIVFFFGHNFRLQPFSQPDHIPLSAIQAVEQLQISLCGPISYPIGGTKSESKQREQGAPTIQKAVPLAMPLGRDAKLVSVWLL
jgi:hypothetical protein